MDEIAKSNGYVKCYVRYLTVIVKQFNKLAKSNG